MAILKKGIVSVVSGLTSTDEFRKQLEELDDGEYGYVVFDKKQNRTLPQLKYLNGLVLKVLSEQLPDHPPVGALYRYFEELYAPIITCEINGQKYEYFDLKRAKSSEMDDVVNHIIHHAKEKWNIDIMARMDLKSPDASMPYIDAYADQWSDYSRTI